MNNIEEKSVRVNVFDSQYDSLKDNEKKNGEECIKRLKNNKTFNFLNKNDNDNNEYNLENNDYDEEDEDENEWKEYHENILVDWADKALCYRWLHSKSCNKYTLLRNIYTIPVIILSTLTGTANFALERVPQEYQGTCQIFIGSLNIIAGIITTISQFLKINELSEGHRVSTISWDKFYRNIRVELIKSPNDRTNVTYVIKSCKDEYDRLMESGPTIDTSIINKFNKTFKMNTTTLQQVKNETIRTISKPEILDSFESTRNIVYKPNQKDTLMSIIKKKKNTMDKENMVEDFINKFNKEYNRKPSVIEIYDNLDSKVSNQIIEKWLNKNKWLRK